jgi:hypothetical protein
VRGSMVLDTTTTDPIEALRNRRNGKLFVCLEAAESPGKVKVINPEGSTLIVLEELFDLEPVMVQVNDQAEHFTAAQIEALEKYRKEQAELAQWRRDNPQRVILDDPEERAERRSSSTPSERKPRKKLAPLLNVKGRVVAEWKADVLTFYRHRIEPLRDIESFVVHVEGQGSFKMTKAEFQRVFNNVVMSSAYRTHGIFKYPSIPAEAENFRMR